MILECPNCETCYETPAVLPEEGRKVKCARCSHVWHAMPTPDPEPEAEPEVEPEPEETVEEVEAAAPDIFEDSEDIGFGANDEEEPEIQENVFEALQDESSFGEANEVVESEPEPETFGAIEEDVFEEPEEEPVKEEPVEQEVAAPRMTVPPTMVSVRRANPAKLIAGWSALGVSVIVTMILAYAFRVEIVKTLPTSAHIYAQFGVDVNVRGLEFKTIRYKRETEAGRPIIRVTGEIVNITGNRVEIPTVVFAFRDERGAELYYLPRKLKVDELPPGHQMPFTIKLPTPSKLVHSFELRFAKSRKEGS